MAYQRQVDDGAGGEKGWWRIRKKIFEEAKYSGGTEVEISLRDGGVVCHFSWHTTDRCSKRRACEEAKRRRTVFGKNGEPEAR